jgi:predicted SAM-dependent methyltransferase
LAEIRPYLEERKTRAEKGLDRGPAVRAIRKVTPFGFRQWAKVNSTTLLLPMGWFKAKSIARESGDNLRLNLGSGPNKIEGWTNVDLAGMSPDLKWDLRFGIPFADGSVQAIFLEHVCEHFPLSAVFGMLEECRRKLKPGGILRIGVPDFGRYMKSYAGDGAFIDELRPGRPTKLLAVAEVALAHGHRSVWDAETLEGVLTEAGFVDVSRKTFGESSLDPVPDTPMREPESVYAEGQKPES